MSITARLSRFKESFSPRPATRPIVVDEQATINAIRANMKHLAHLAIKHNHNHQLQWNAYIDNILAETESVVFMTAAEQNVLLQNEYDSVRCKVLMQFSKHDNLCLNNGTALSANWDTLRQDIIASRSSI